MKAFPECVVVIPTVRGREADLAQTAAAFEETAPCIVMPMHGFPTVGGGWTAGVREVKAVLGDSRSSKGPTFIQFGNDDMWPDPGWYEAATRQVEAGFTPCPVMRKPNGAFESGGIWGRLLPDQTVVEWTPLPFFRFDEWSVIGPVPPIHYFSDCWFATSSIYKAKRPIRLDHAYAFTHSWAMPGRKPEAGEAYEREGRLWKEYEAACKSGA